MEASYLALGPTEAATLEAVVERLFPADEQWPGARELGVGNYIDRYAYTYPDEIDPLIAALGLINRMAKTKYGHTFVELDASVQDSVLKAWDEGENANSFEKILELTRQGLFGDPAYGGNRNKTGWAYLGMTELRSLSEIGFADAANNKERV